jgi:hypothetical protein
VIEQKQLVPNGAALDSPADHDRTPMRSENSNPGSTLAALPAPNEADDDFVIHIVRGIRADVLTDDAEALWSEPDPKDWTARGFDRPAASSRANPSAADRPPQVGGVRAWFRLTARKSPRVGNPTAEGREQRTPRRTATTNVLRAWMRGRFKVPSRRLMLAASCGIAAWLVPPSAIHLGMSTPTAGAVQVQHSIESTDAAAPREESTGAMPSFDTTWEGARRVLSRLNPFASPGAGTVLPAPIPAEPAASTVASAGARPRRERVSHPPRKPSDAGTAAATPLPNTPARDEVRPDIANEPLSEPAPVPVDLAGTSPARVSPKIDDAAPLMAEPGERHTSAPPEWPARNTYVYDASDASVTPPRPLAKLLYGMSSDKGRDTAPVAVLVNEDGSVSSVRAERALRTMAESLAVMSAISVVKGWRFEPAMKGDMPVRYRWIVWVGATGVR